MPSKIKLPPEIKLPPAARGWSDDKKEKWMQRMLEYEAMKTAPEGVSVEKALDQSRNVARRAAEEKRNKTASPTRQSAKTYEPTIEGARQGILDYRKKVDSYKGGGAVKKKKVVAKMTPRKKTVAKRAARRGMGKAMRGR